MILRGIFTKRIGMLHRLEQTDEPNRFRIINTDGDNSNGVHVYRDEKMRRWYGERATLVILAKAMNDLEAGADLPLRYKNIGVDQDVHGDWILDWLGD